MKTIVVPQLGPSSAKPRFDVPLIRQTFFAEPKTKQALTAFIRQAPQLSFGPHCEQFEREFSAYQGRAEAVFVNSGSSANLALIQALLNMGTLKKGDKVGFSALTWSTNVMPLIELGLVPVPIDVELDTLNISGRTVAAVLEKHRLQALFITHLLGLCDQLEVIQQLCRAEEIVLLEDTCEALGSEYQQKKLGNWGMASTFSFYVGHHLSTIEGGMICVDDPELATMLRIVRAHGWDRNLAEQPQRQLRQKHQVNSSFYSRYTFYDLGYNLRPTEINGFLGRLQLQFIPDIIAARQRHFQEVAAWLYQQPDYYPVRTTQMDVYSCFAVPVVCRSQAVRDALVSACSDRIEIRPIVGGDMTQQPFFQRHVPARYQLPTSSVANLIHHQGLYFGNYPEMTNQDLATIHAIFGHHGKTNS